MSFHNYLISLFTLSEVLLLVLKRSKKKSVKSRDDRRSLLLFWITIPVCLALGSAVRHLALPADPLVFENAGVAVFIIGFIIRWLSIIQLGSMFTVDVSISSTHTLKTNGLYKIIRHPSYLGLMLIIAGISLFMSNWLSCVVIIVPVFMATNYRIRVEEKVLTAEFGSQYDEYKQKVKKIIPLLY